MSKTIEILGEIVKMNNGGLHIISSRELVSGRYVYNEETGNAIIYDEAVKNQGWGRLSMIEASDDLELKLPYVPITIARSYAKDPEKSRVSIILGEHNPNEGNIRNTSIAEVAAMGRADSIADAYTKEWNDEYDRVYKEKLEEMEKEFPSSVMLPYVNEDRVLVCRLIPKYVVLEHLTLPDRGFRFWSMNTLENTKLYTGEVVYKEVLLTDDQDEAMRTSQRPDRTKIPTFSELMEFYRDNANRD